MSKRFSYVKYDKIAVQKQQDLREKFEDIEAFCFKNLSATRENALIMTALEEAYMWTGKAIRDEQIIRNGGQIEDVKERG